jgi:hypothetical protein
MDWTMFWFWTGVILILAAALVPNEKYNWGSLLYSTINNFLAKREAKKYPDFAARWKEYNVKEKELEKFYNEKIIETNRNIQRCITVLCHLEEEDFRRGIIEETLKEDRDELLECETLYQEISSELDKEFQQLREERRRLGIKHI